MALIGKRPEVAPVDCETFPGGGLHAQVSTLGRDSAPHRVQVLFQDADSTLESERAKPLRDQHGAGGRVLREPFGNGRLEGIQLAGTLLPCRSWGWRV
jgi:hypothetical protein